MPALISEAPKGNCWGGHTAVRLADQAQFGKTGWAIQSTSKPMSTTHAATAGERVAPSVLMVIYSDHRSKATEGRRRRRSFLRNFVNHPREGFPHQEPLAGEGALRSPRSEYDLRKPISRQPPSSGVGFPGLRIARTAATGAGLSLVWPLCARPLHHRRPEISHFLGMPRSPCGNTISLSGFPSRRPLAAHRLTAASKHRYTTD